MEHLSQLERAIPTFILNSVLVTEYVEYPNKHKNLKTKVCQNFILFLSVHNSFHSQSQFGSLTSSVVLTFKSVDKIIGT